MKVPFIDIAREIAPLRAQLDQAIAGVLDSARFIGGPELEAFERELAAHAGVAHAVGVSSGTDALLSSLMALGVGRGDEVVTTAYSFFATAQVIYRLGATPVFVDIEDKSFNLDPAAAAAACGPRTRAILPVHLFGRPATIPSVPGIAVVEDAAQSLGAAPLVGDAAAVSFFPTKNLGGFGDGGAVLCADAALADRIRLLRSQGARPKYHHVAIGGNFRLDAIQAAILRVRLRGLADATRTRRANAERYRALAAAASLSAEVVLPEDHPQHIYNQFVIRTPRRDALRQALAEAGIATEVYYPVPMHQQRCVTEQGTPVTACPEAERASRESLALPIAPALAADQQEYVIEQLVAFFGRD